MSIDRCPPPDQPDRSSSNPDVSVNPFPAWRPNDKDFDVVGQATLAQSANRVFTVLARFMVPAGCEGVLQFWGQDALRCDAWANVHWRIRVSGDVRLYFPPIAQLAGIAQNDMSPVNVTAIGDMEFVIEASNAGATAQLVTGRIKGMFRPGHARRGGA